MSTYHWITTPGSREALLTFSILSLTDHIIVVFSPWDGIFGVFGCGMNVCAVASCQHYPLYFN